MGGFSLGRFSPRGCCVVKLIAPQSSFPERTGAQFHRRVKSRQIWRVPLCNTLDNNHLLLSIGTPELTAVWNQRACARLESSPSQIAAYIEEGIESAEPAGWPLMGLRASGSGSARGAVTVELSIRFLFAIIPAWHSNTKRLTGNRCGRGWRCSSPPRSLLRCDWPEWRTFR